MNRKVVAVVSIFVVVLIGVLLLGQEPEKSPVDNPPDNTDRVLEIKAVEETSYGVRPTSSFEIWGANDLAEEELRSQLQIEPGFTYQVNYEEEKITLIPDQPLIKHQVYRFSLQEEGWAFQTLDNLKLVKKFPRDQATHVPTSTGIELTFNGDQIKDISSYFTIEPAVSGEFRKEGQKIIFIPEELLANKTYRVSIKPGLADEDGRSLEEEVAFSFSTGSYISYGRPGARLLQTASADRSQFINLTSFNYFGEQYDKALVYQVEEETFMEAYQAFTEKGSGSLAGKDYPLVHEADVENLIVDDQIYVDIGQRLENGYYIIQLDSELPLVVFYQVGEALAYYANLSNGQLFWVADTDKGSLADQVTILRNDEEIGKTNEEGLYYEGIPRSEDQTLYSMVLNGRKYLLSSADEAHDMYYYEDFYFQQGKFWTFLYTDRKAYRRDDLIKIFGFAKGYEGQSLAGAALQLIPYTNDEVTLTAPIDFRDDGTFASEMALEDVEHGGYELRLMVQDQVVASSYLMITEFEKPEFYLETQVDKEILFMEDTLNIDATAYYYSGYPYEGLDLYARHGDYGNEQLTPIVKTDVAGLSQFSLVPYVDTTSWMPIPYTLRFVNDNIERVTLEHQEVVTLIPRDTMVVVDLDEVNEQVEVSISLNEISLDKYDGTFGENYEHLKGSPVDTSLEVVITEYYQVLISEESYYDPIEKRTQIKKSYRESERVFLEESLRSPDGLASLSFTPNPDNRYRVRVTTKDQKGRIIEQSYSYAPSYYDAHWYQERKYSIYDNFERYPLNQPITLDIMHYGQPLKDEEEVYLLEMILRDGLRELDVRRDIALRHELTEEDLPNVFIAGVVFDGQQMRELQQYGPKMLAYDYSEREVNLVVTSDKNTYQPGEEARIEIKATYADGSPFIGTLNVSVVDEAFFALFEDHQNVLRELFQSYYNAGLLYSSISSGDGTPGMFGAEGGDGGGGVAIRSIFKDTAGFATIKTNQAGEGTYTFEVPDNLTSWRITVHGINEALYAGQTKYNVEVGLPFFLRTFHNRFYRYGDYIETLLTSDGDQLQAEQAIEYTLSLGEEEIQKTAPAKELVHLPIGALDKDTEIVITAQQGEMSDGIKETLRVRDYYSRVAHTIGKDVATGYQPSFNDRAVTLRFYNASAQEYFDSIKNLTGNSLVRFEERFATMIRDELLAEYLGYEVYGQVLSIEEYQHYRGGIYQLSVGEPDLETTGIFAATGLAYDYLEGDLLKDYLITALGEEGLTGEDYAAALWGLSRLGEPVLVALDELEKAQELSEKAQYYVLLARVNQGDVSAARATFESLTPPEEDYGLKLLHDILRANLGQDQYYEGLENEEVPKDSAYGLLRVMYLMDVVSPVVDGQLVYRLDGEEIVAQFDKLEPILVTIEKGQDFELVSMDQDFFVEESFRVTGADQEHFSTQTLTLERSYEAESVDLGQEIIVTLKGKKPLYSAIEITDALPGGFDFVRVISSNVRLKEEGNVLRLYQSKQEGAYEIQYVIKAVQPGQYGTEPAIIRAYGYYDLNMSDAPLLEIKP